MTDNEMLQTGLNYELLVEDALRSVVRNSLNIVQKVGLPGDTHFYISFLTTHPRVEISGDLRTKHPENMTIVLQHQFADLSVGRDEFSITLFFAGKPSPMVIPFQSITSFNDPSVGFGLQFGSAGEDSDEGERNMPDVESNLISDKCSDHDSRHGNKQGANSGDAPTQLQKRDGNTRQITGDGDDSADIVSLDSFRKKPT
tara:strand:+ start:72 stop:671 length:600 start_codon:yes stop_codon:yes gene_type:complete